MRDRCPHRSAGSRRVRTALVMFYRQLRLLNRWNNGTRRSCSGRRYERTRGVVSRMGGEATAGATGFLQAADVLPRYPVLTGECLKDHMVAGARFDTYIRVAFGLNLEPATAGADGGP